MKQTAQFWWGMIVGLLLGVFLLACWISFWIWRHHMFILGISNRGALIVSAGCVAGPVLLGVAIGRMSKPINSDKLDA